MSSAPLYRLSKKFRFEASHQLMNHDGICARLHGHSYNGEIVVQGLNLNETGPQGNMLVDFSELKNICTKIEQKLDHRHLNDVLETSMPTAEFIAKWIVDSFSITLPSGVTFHKIAVEETCTSRVEYLP